MVFNIKLRRFELHPILYVRESDKVDEDVGYGSSGKQLKLSNVGFGKASKRKIEEIESSGKGRCKFFHSRKLEQLTYF